MTVKRLRRWGQGVLRRPERMFVVALLVGALAVISFLWASSAAKDRTTPSGRPEFDGSALELRGNISSEGIVDSDRDWIPDVEENFAYGTNPNRWNTSGTNIPDGWLVRFGLDPLDPSAAVRPAASPPAESLPQAYQNVWPPRFQLTLREIYAYGRPTEWNESEQGPYDNRLNPLEWDNNHDGIPDGFAVHFQLDPTADVTDERLAGPSGLTVREAYEHGTDPRKLDTDEDGIPDREEIEGPLNPAYPSGPFRFRATNPRAFSTSGAGVCDGYLRAHGFDPSEDVMARGDPDNDGATTLAEFNWSQARYGPEACARGVGLNPSRMSSVNGSIPDGWLLRYALDPLDSSVAKNVTQTSDSDPGATNQIGPNSSQPVRISLTVLDEYRFGRPSTWDERAVGPWWGGTDPIRLDTDGDGLGDALEQYGFVVEAATDVGGARPLGYRTVSDPTRKDTDGDGLTDTIEVRPSPSTPRSIPPTDPRRKDTDFDGIPDAVEVVNEFGLNPTRADSAGDSLRDGERLELLVSRMRETTGDRDYPYPGPPDARRSVLDWIRTLPGASNLSNEASLDDLQRLLEPTGDLDGDGIHNIVDPDLDNDGLLNGWELRPSLYAGSDAGVGVFPGGRPATDPLNHDTDGDLLLDGWELRHGTPDYALRRYNLDPARWDSDGDGVSDAQEDPDADGVLWYAVQNGKRMARQFDLPNIKEQQYGTHPNQFDTDGDNLADGWKVFWGLVYPTLGPTSDPPLGSVYPGAPGPMQIPVGREMPSPGRPQRQVTVSQIEYTRFVLSPTERNGTEQIVRSFLNLPDGQGGTRAVYEIHGTRSVSFLDVQAAHMNPYLADTDGDGMSDAWEILVHQRPGSASFDPAGCIDGPGLDPTLPDAATDADSDGLTNSEEYGLQSDPRCADTDLAALGDGQERDFSLDPADPEDDRRVLEDSSRDADADGIPDYQEIIGVHYDYLGSVPVRTRFDNPDTDGDGLLDGRTQPESRSVPDGWNLDDPRSMRFLDLGIVFTIVNGKVFFQGEVDWGTDPENADDSGTGVPAGWLIAYGINPHGATDQENQYGFGKPDWWDERLHGPWWGGTRAFADVNLFKSMADRDKDGLGDHDGDGGFEDPMPFANRYNQYRPVGTLHMRSEDRPWQDSLGELERRALAQAFVNPRRLTDRAYQFDETVAGPQSRTPCLEVTTEGHPLLIHKGTPLVMQGRVLDCATGTGIPRVPLEGRLGERFEPHGVAFSSSDGSFSMSFNISGGHSFEVPSGVVYKGTQGPRIVNWSTDPSIVPVGPQSLVVRTYALQDSNPSIWTSKASSISVEVRAETQLALKVPTSVISGHEFSVSVRLTDSGGGPLQQAIALQWGGGQYAISPNERGEGSLLLPAPHELAGQQTLEAVSPPSSQYLTEGRASEQVEVRRPTTIELKPTDKRVDAGSSLALHGRLLVPLGAPPITRVTLNLTQAGRVVTSANITSDANGNFQALVLIPKTTHSGPHSILALSQRTETTTAGEQFATVGIRSIPRFLEVSQGPIYANESALVSARLLDVDGSPLSNASIRVSLSTAEREAKTDSSGAISTKLPISVAHVPVVQVLAYDGDANHTSSRIEHARTPIRTAHVTLEERTVVRGTGFLVPVSLEDGSGKPIQGVPLHLKWGSHPKQTALTRSDGTAHFPITIPPTVPLGPVSVVASFEGDAPGGLLASSASARWNVSSRVNLSLPAGDFLLGSAIPPGRVTDAVTGRPLADAEIEISTDSRQSWVTRTNETGHFSMGIETPPEGGPFQASLRAVYLGNQTYPQAHAFTVLQFKAPTEIVLGSPPPIVTGRDTILWAAVKASSGSPNGGTIRMLVNETVVGQSEVQVGQDRVNIRIPDSVTAGPQRLRAEYSGSDSYAASSLEIPVSVLIGARLLPDAIDRSNEGLVVVAIRAIAKEQPIPFAEVHLFVPGESAGLTALTDDHGVARFVLPASETQRTYWVRYAGSSLISPVSIRHTLAPEYATSASSPVVGVVALITLGFAVLLSSFSGYLHYFRTRPLEGAIRRARHIVLQAGPLERQILEAYQILEDAAIGYRFLDAPAVTAGALVESLQPLLPPKHRPLLASLVDTFEAVRYGDQSPDSTTRDRVLSHLDDLIIGLQESRIGKRSKLVIATERTT